MRLTEEDLKILAKKILKEQSGLNLREKTEVISNKPRKVVKNFINNLPKGTAIVRFENCEFADFSYFNLAEFPRLDAIVFVNTPNNFDGVENQRNFEVIERNNGIAYLVKRIDRSGSQNSEFRRKINLLL